MTPQGLGPLSPGVKKVLFDILKRLQSDHQEDSQIRLKMLQATTAAELIEHVSDLSTLHERLSEALTASLYLLYEANKKESRNEPSLP